MGKSSRKLTPKVSMPSHIIRFIGFNVLVALIPLAASYVVRDLAEVTAPAGTYAQELLFFSVSVCATGLSDLMDERFTGEIRWWFDILKVALLVSIVGAALLFGVYQYEDIISPVNTNIRNNIMPLSVWMAFITFFVSLVAEMVIAYTREK